MTTSDIQTLHYDQPRLKSLPLREQPAYRVSHDVNACNLTELLATVIGGQRQIEISQDLLARFEGDLRRIYQAHPTELASVRGISHATATRIKAALTKRGTTLASVRDKITALNLLLRGWANYYRHSAANSTFDYIGSYAFKRMELWLRKKTRLRVRAVYKRYYRRNRWLTWAADGESLYHTALMNIEYKRYAHRPNPYLDPSKPVLLPYHLNPHPGKREWDGTNSRYGETWTEIREEIRRRDEERCTLCGSQDRVEIHHLRKHKGNKEHYPERLIALCATCHRNARNLQSEVSRRIARLYLRTGKPDEAKVSRPVWEEA